MLQVLGWVALAAFIVFAVTFGLHMYRMKNDRYYKHMIDQAAQDDEMRRKLAHLGQSENPHLRELAKKLGKGRGA